MDSKMKRHTLHAGKKVLRLFTVYRDVFATESKNCLGVVHIRMTVIAIWQGARKQGFRLELFTPYHKFRFRF